MADRRKKTTLSAIFEQELLAPTVVRVDGRRRKLAYIQGLLQQVKREAAQGDAKARADIFRLFPLLPKAQTDSATDRKTAYELSDADEAIVRAFFESQAKAPPAEHQP